jgi:flagellar hook-associated protein 2
LDSALSANYGAVKSLFINQAAATGVAQRLNLAVDGLDDVVSGALTLRKNGLTDRISDLTAEITNKETLLSQYEERVQRQYAALDSLLRQLQSQSSFLQTRFQSTQGN